MSRIATARDPTSLLDRVAAALVARGAKVSEAPKPYSRLLEIHGGCQIELWAVASPHSALGDCPGGLAQSNLRCDIQPDSHRRERRRGPSPAQRDVASVMVWIASLPPNKSRYLLAPDLCALLRDFDKKVEPPRLWLELTAGFTSPPIHLDALQ